MNYKILLIFGAIALIILSGVANTGSLVDDSIQFSETDLTKYQITYNDGILTSNPNGKGTLTMEQYASVVYGREYPSEKEQIINVQNNQFKFVVNSLSVHMTSATAYAGLDFEYSIYLNNVLIDTINSPQTKYYSTDGKVYSEEPTNFEGIKAIFGSGGQVIGGSLNPVKKALIVSTYKIVIPDASTQEVEEITNEPSTTQNPVTSTSQVNLGFVDRINLMFQTFVDNLRRLLGL